MTPTENPFLYAVAWTLFHFLWEGALIALALWAGLYLFRPTSASLRYGVACAALFAMLVAFGLTLVVVWPRNAGAVPAGGPQVPRWDLLTPAAPSDGTDSVATQGSSPLRWIVLAWVLGVALFTLRSLASWAGALRLRRVGVCAAPDFWQRRLGQIAERIHLSRPVILLESCLMEVPVVIGFLRPVILVPAGLLAGFSSEQLEYILIHELAHIRRYDYLVNLLQSLVEDLLFYHPAVWWVSGLMRAERENCCDDVVVAARGDAHGLAAALAALEHYRWNAREAALASNGGHLMNRIRRLLEGNEAPHATAAPIVLMGLLLASVALSMAGVKALPPHVPVSPAAVAQVAPSAAAVTAPRQANVLLAQAPANRAETNQTQISQVQVSQVQTPGAPNQQLFRELQLSAPFRKWLNEDVVWIASPEERAEFLNLQTDSDRQQFIQQFWLRRDPTPGTPENEFMQEHYRRISYANDRFSAKSVPGWKTDRGRIYITFGPPDEIDSHATGGVYQRPIEQGGGTTSTFPFEQWRYRYIQGMGSDVYIEFVDTNLTGEYHMTMDPNEKDALRAAPGTVPRVQPQ